MPVKYLVTGGAGFQATQSGEYRRWVAAYAILASS